MSNKLKPTAHLHAFVAQGCCRACVQQSAWALSAISCQCVLNSYVWFTSNALKKLCLHTTPNLRNSLFLSCARHTGLNKKYVTNQLSAAAAASATAQEVLAGIRTVKSFAKEEQTINT